MKKEPIYGLRFKGERPENPYINFYVPPLYRTMEKKYVDEFYEKGNLRLSSFLKFKTTEDSKRKDPDEGVHEILYKYGNKHIKTKTYHGYHNYILCASTKEDILTSELSNDLAHLIIEKPIPFMHEISKQIPEFIGMRFGPVSYISSGQIKKTLENFDIEIYKDDKGKLQLFELMQELNKYSGDDALFTKRSEYSFENEYRLIWDVFSEKAVDGFLDIVVPDARKYCRQWNEK